jgi:hypothetical protein
MVPRQAKRFQMFAFLVANPPTAGARPPKPAFVLRDNVNIGGRGGTDFKSVGVLGIVRQPIRLRYADNYRIRHRGSIPVAGQFCVGLTPLFLSFYKL